MKRDMDLVRLLLLELEDAPEHVSEDDLLKRARLAAIVDDMEWGAIEHHLAIMDEAGLIDGYRDPYGRPAEPYSRNRMRLTWQGHEFLDTIRDAEVWRETKAGASKVGGM